MKKQILQNKKSGSRLHFENYRRLLKCKRSFDLPFSWIFSAIAGAFIIFIAVYAAVRLVGTQQTEVTSEAAKDVANFLNPVVNSVSSAFATKMDFNKETKLQFGCEVSSRNSPTFGRQIIAFSEQSGFLNKWTDFGANISRYNKYVFADNIEQGKTVYIFSKPFYAGFRVDDLIMMTSKDYCFVAPPQFVEDEISMLGMKNVNTSSEISGCKKNSVSVCFDSGVNGCNITVSGECENLGITNCKSEFDIGKVEKNSKTMYYFGSLMYGAIFSSPEIYECNIQRLAKKTNILASIYSDKINIMKLQGCSSNIEDDLNELAEKTKTITSSAKLMEIYSVLKTMDEKACNEKICAVYDPENC